MELMHPRTKKLCLKKFGRLTAIRPEGRYRNENTWLCLCECGKFTHARSGQLTRGSKKSCGCLLKYLQSGVTRYKGFKEISGDYWNRTIKGAKQRNLEFKITIEYAWSIFELQSRLCALSGMPIKFGSYRRNDASASLDRIDSSKGYVEGNVQWLHKCVNIMKLDHNQDIFLDFVSKIYEFQKCKV